MESGATLRDYQIEGVNALRSTDRFILADEPGIGKSAQLLTAAEGRVLIVSPAMLQDVWIGDDGEVAKWRPDLLDEQRVVWVPYSSICERGPDKAGRMTVPLERVWPAYRGPWDTVILDESHYIKERKTRWTKAIRNTVRTDRLFMATGTPLPNWGYEIYTSLCMLFPDEAKPGRWLGNYWNWVGEWFNVAGNYFNEKARIIGELLPGWTWEEFAEGNRLQGKWLRRERDNVLADLPPLFEQTIQIPMTDAQDKVYKRLAKDLYAIVEETGNEIISWSKSGVWTKLLKLSTGIEVEDPSVKGYSNKITTLRELMVGRTHPTLVFCMFRASAAACARALTEDGFRVGVVSGEFTSTIRRQTIRDFRAGRLNVLVGTLGTMSEGLTLTEADTSIFIERDPRPSKNLQALRRSHRMGQTRPCHAIHLITPRSVDSVLLDLVSTKSDHQMAAIRAFDLLQMVQGV